MKLSLAVLTLPGLPHLANTTATSPPSAATPLPHSDSSARATAPNRRRLHSQDLLGQAREIEIQHGQALYRLRHTALGKLILTK